jgi:hypothetical protein
MATMAVFYERTNAIFDCSIEVTYQRLEGLFNKQKKLNKYYFRNRKFIQENLIRIDETLETLSYLKFLKKQLMEEEEEEEE